MTLRATIIAASVAIAAAWTPTAQAHKTSATRSAMVQIEDEHAVVLVSWTAPSGLFGRLLMMRAALAGSHARDVLEDLLTRHALAPLTITIDGKRAPIANVRTKINVDRSSMATHRVAVLVEIPLPAKPCTVTVTASGPQPTRLLWTPRTSRRRPTSDTKAGVWRWSPAPIAVQLR